MRKLILGLSLGIGAMISAYAGNIYHHMGNAADLAYTAGQLQAEIDTLRPLVDVYQKALDTYEELSDVEFDASASEAGKRLFQKSRQRLHEQITQGDMEKNLERYDFLMDELPRIEGQREREQRLALTVCF